MTGQDWLEKDFYAALGVAKDADAAAIKKAYRKLARQYHPDQNAGDPKSESRFKEIGEAYAVLSDPSEREKYDAIRAMGGGARFAAGPGGAGSGGFEDMFGSMFGAGAGGGSPAGGRAGFGAGGFEDILGGLFNGGGAGFRGGPRPQQGADLTTSVTLPFRQAVEGSEVALDIEHRTIKTRIPAGVHDGQKIRLRGKGRPGTGGAPAGDLIITVAVAAHPVFALDGRNLRVTVPVTFDEAALGTQLEVPALDGSTVKVKVAPGTPSGRVLRVKGRGVATAKATGDLLVTIQVVVPQNLSSDARKAVEAFRDATQGTNVRADLLARAKD